MKIWEATFLAYCKAYRFKIIVPTEREDIVYFSKKCMLIWRINKYGNNWNSDLSSKTKKKTDKILHFILYNR